MSNVALMSSARLLLPRATLMRYKWWTSKQSVTTTPQRRNSSQASGVWVEAKPRVCLHDVHTELTAGGLSPNVPITLTANLVDENGKRFCSNGHFITDKDGNVDLRDAASVGGSYKGVFPAGLLTTLSSIPHEKSSYRLYRRDPLTPWKVTVDVMAGHTNLTSQPEVLAQVEMERHLVAPGVQRLPVRNGKVRGALYLPPGPGPFPGIIDLFGYTGGLLEFRSAMLASRGFASLALAVFNYDDLPKSTKILHFDYFEAAVQFLLSHTKIIPDRCGVIANSKSGEIGLNMAVLLEPVKAVVGVNALTFPFHTEYYYKGKSYIKGIDIPPNFSQKDEHGSYCFDFRKLFNNDLPHMIPIEKADDDTHFLIACGEDDSMGFKHSIPVFTERMQRNNRKNFTTILYPGTGHILQPPYDAFIKTSHQSLIPNSETRVHLDERTMLTWGGEPQGTCDAQVDMWQRMQGFFMKHVRDDSLWFQNYLQTST